MQLGRRIGILDEDGLLDWTYTARPPKPSLLLGGAWGLWEANPLLDARGAAGRAWRGTVTRRRDWRKADMFGMAMGMLGMRPKVELTRLYGTADKRL